MGHTAGKRWNDVNRSVGTYSEHLITALSNGEELYLQLTEMWLFSGGNDQDVADLLFQDENRDNETGLSSPATTEQVAMAVDAKAAVTAMHTIYEAANNIATAQDDRLSKLRRMT